MTHPQPLLPLGLIVSGRRALVVGAGAVALRRVTALLAAGAAVTVVAPAATGALVGLAASHQLIWLDRDYQRDDLAGAWLAFACTDDAAVNATVASDAEAQQIFCVRADDAAQGTAWNPAVGRTGSLTVSVHADRDPRRAAALRDLLIETAQAAPIPAGRPSVGRVVLVGGGPGDPGLITVAGRAALAEADVIVADRLAPLALLDELAPQVLVIDAAKVPGGHQLPQEEINRLLIHHAQQGKMVVRLKGGDPFVFGRGGEEAEACVAAGLGVEVIPGVTSAISVPALAGIPVTHRGLVQGFTVVSGHVPPGDPKSTVDWDALARVNGTLIVLMGLHTIRQIGAALLMAGLAADTPVACIENGATTQVRTIRSTLAGIARDVAAAEIQPPAIFVIGAVAALGG